MSTTADLLIEIGTEELPPKALTKLAQAFADVVVANLEKAQLPHDPAQVFAAPRRLALFVPNLTTRQADQQVERRGPAVKAAFDQDGKPSKAAEGFARSCGVEVADLGRLKTDKGEWLAYTITETGVQTADLIADICATALQRLPIPKRMRWGAGDAEFVRPVHWLVGLLGDNTVPGGVLGLSFGRTTFGHRFHAPQAIELKHASEYANKLRDAFVVADFAERRASVEKQVVEAMATLGAATELDADLLDEVTALVEWPVAVTGDIPQHYLELPPEVLVTTIQEHQRYFPAVAADGKLLPNFVTVANIASRDPERVKVGNERVVKPRLDDALFFWQQDRKQPLISHREKLKAVRYQAKLGSVYDKSARVAKLAAHIANSLGYDVAQTQRAAELAKCDLLTDLVYEFTELQGIMGRYYAVADGEDAAVAQAMEDQYRPRFAGDELPAGEPGRALALADKLDSITGNFSIGKKPTGDRDPFGLRRAGLGVLRILIEQQLPLDLNALCAEAASAYPTADGELASEVAAFITERLKAYLAEQAISADLFEAVAAVKPSQPLDFVARVTALKTFAAEPAADSLAAAHKRTNNLLKKADAESALAVDPNNLLEDAEKDLFSALQQVAEPAQQAAKEGDYAAALTQLATLKDPVDAFFDSVMVLADEPALRINRVALLKQLASAFNSVADLGCLQRN